MSYYRIGKIKIAEHEALYYKDFDDKEDAEHYAKNESTNDSHHRYEVEKNDHGKFVNIKSYQNGEVI